MDQLLGALLAHGGLVQLAVFVVPGFIAWRTYQLRRPEGEQKAASAFVEILASSVFVYVLWYAHAWTAWPNTWPLALLFLAQVFVTPVVVALGYQTLLEFCSSRYWITSAHPRAWDIATARIATLPRKPAKGAAAPNVTVTPSVPLREGAKAPQITTPATVPTTSGPVSVRDL